MDTRTQDNGTHPIAEARRRLTVTSEEMKLAEILLEKLGWPVRMSHEKAKKAWPDQYRHFKEACGTMSRMGTVLKAARNQHPELDRPTRMVTGKAQPAIATNSPIPLCPKCIARLQRLAGIEHAMKKL